MRFDCDQISSRDKKEASVNSAARAILAHGFIHQCVQFGTRQRNLVGSLSPPSQVSGSSAPPPGGGLDVIPGARRHQFRHLAWWLATVARR